jgi:heptosyltransferase-2
VPGESSKEISFAIKAPNWLGDSIMALPALAGLTDCARRSRILVLASTTSAEVCTRVPGTLVFAAGKPGSGVVSSLAALRRGTAALRHFSPVIALSLTRSATSALMLALGRPRRRVGFADSALSLLYTDRVAWPGKSVHLTDSYCSLVESIGIRIPDRVPRLEPTAEDLRCGGEVLEGTGLQTGRYLCFFPGARYGPSKRWPARRFALLGQSILDRFGTGVVLLGGAGDGTVCAEVERLMAGAAHNLCGTLSFAQLAGVLAGSRAVVSNDSGGMHLAAALGRPTVGLFFSTNPSWTGPRSGAAEVLYNPVACSPCFRRDCGHTEKCTGSITTEEVMSALERIPEK